MASKEVSAPYRASTNGFSYALAVFQNLSNLELVKSVHLYMDDGSITAIQQEFLLSPGVYAQISEPIPSYFSKFAPKGAEQFMSTLKHLNEADFWQCVLEYNSHTPQSTSIVPLLSVSKNPALQYLPSLAEDLAVVEKAVQNQGHGHQCMYLLGPPSSTEQQQYPCQLSPDAWKESKWNLFALSALTVETPSVPQGDVLPTETHEQVENVHEWGSDLELASPRMLDTCILGSTWSTSITNPPLTALMSAPSPESGIVTSCKADCTFWTPSSLVLEEKMTGACDSQTEGSSLSGECNQGQAKLVLNCDSSHAGALLPFTSLPVQASINALSHNRNNPGSLSVKRVAKSTRSLCSDESVGTPAGSERLPPEALMTGTSECRNEEGMVPETDSFQLSKFNNRPGGLRDSMATQSILDKVAEPQNPRGPTERMTDITLNELSQYFHMPITQASKELKVGLTVLKKRCREFGIPRWPHRKMKSLDSLIHNIQVDTGVGKGPRGKTSAPVMSAVKELEHQKKRMEERPGIELAERTKRLRQACFKASYKKRRQAQTSLAQQESVGGVSVNQGFALVL